MAIEKVHIDKFLELSESFPVLDVRSPGEFTHAHMPGAFSLPLFTDEERRIVGTAYKQQSRQTAIKLGLDFFGPKMRQMVETVEEHVRSVSRNNGSHPNTVLAYCWRGGMRSAAVAWLLDMYGFKVYTLAGGYKTFRNWVLKQLDIPYRINILGGFTGSGKTEVLKELERMKETVIDLEALAGHKGSAFGNIGLPPQPSQEMFENKLVLALNTSKKIADKQDKPIWLEDESQRIGTVNIPQPFWLNMRSSPVYFLDIPFNERLEHIVAEYGSLDKERMLNAITRLQKRLGGLETKTAITHLQEGNIQDCFQVLLKYYDKYYLKGLHNRNNVQELLFNLSCKKIDAANNAHAVIRSVHSIPVQ